MSGPDWSAKVLALLHDPPGKHEGRWYKATDGKKGHEALARKLLTAVGPWTEDEPADLADVKPADRWSSSADRPQLGLGFQVAVPWRKAPRINHPLEDAGVLGLPSEREAVAPSKITSHIANKIGALAPKDPTDEDAFYWLWRAAHPALASAPPPGVSPADWRIYVDHGPADTRAPDHSLWDHVRVTSMLAWVPTHDPTKGDDPANRPWMLSVQVGPVGAMLREARTTRDLWTASMLISELSLAAMGPVIARFGPDAIVYPDLANNLRYDRELARRAKSPLTEAERAARTRAALIPDNWLAVIGPASADEVRQLGAACQQAALDWWRGLSVEVMEAFLEHGESAKLWSTEEERDAVEATWRAQAARHDEVYVHWSALPWHPATPPASKPVPPSALPSQPTLVAGHAAYRAARAAHLARYEGLVPMADLLRYDHASYVYGLTATTTRKGGSTSTLRQEGHDYALAQHAVRAALAARNDARTVPKVMQAAGDACTACGKRASLGGGQQTTDKQREAAGDLWARISRSIGWGADTTERLCGVCATRRFLVPPWETEPPSEADAGGRFHAIWAGPEDYDARTKRLRLPMPSTAAIAAGPYLAELAQRTDDTTNRKLGEVVAAAREANWPRTFFADSLRSVGGSLAAAGPVAEPRFWELEPTVLFDGPREAQLAAEAEADAVAAVLEWNRKEPTSSPQERAERLRTAREHAKKKWEPRTKRLKRAVWDLLGRRVRTDDGVGDRAGAAPPASTSRGPSSRFAVIAVDGDNLGKLLLGHAHHIGATWREVLHPLAVEQILSQAASGYEWAKAWVELLDHPRLMGPSLHAFLNRALTRFANVVVPWVVEREFGGRLIYCGGDDVLALAPADDALGIAARLQQLWSAAWVVDTRVGEGAWDRNAPWDPTRDRQRFRVASLTPGEAWDAHEPAFRGHVWGGDGDEPLPADWALFPMLGRHQSLSAGIAYAHFKTPLQLVIDAAKRALDDAAKERGGRSACAEVVFTRNGAKYTSVFHWGELHHREAAVKAAKRVREAFREGDVASRLPYKLREAARGLRVLVDHDVGERAMRGLIRQAVDGKLDDALFKDVLTLWKEGLRADASDDVGVGNLLLARTLAADEGEEA